MPVFRLTSESITPLPESSFAAKGVRERDDLQRLLRANIAVVAPDVLIICDEFEEWDGSRRRIDLLGIDREGSLVVIELKRNDDGGHMELQAIRYAAMVSRMTFQRATRTFQAYLIRNGDKRDARSTLLQFMRVSEAGGTTPPTAFRATTLCAAKVVLPVLHSLASPRGLAAARRPGGLLVRGERVE